MWKSSLSAAFVLSCAALAAAAPIDNPWPTFRAPSTGPARAIGEYSSGCLSGAVALPLDGPGYQVMRPSRLRYFGHPELVSFVQGVAQRVHENGHDVLLVGDLSQPRGGRAAGGHASHQTGLDVDVWFWHPKSARKAPLSLSMREDLAAPSILEKQTGAIRKGWQKRVARMLALAVADERVDRIFVNPNIKRELCALPDPDKSWLRKVRPWHGHDDHFHARLACPSGSEHCRPQQALPAGDGCDQLGFWFDAAAQAARARAQAEYQKSVTSGRRWPEQCDALLDGATSG